MISVKDKVKHSKINPTQRQFVYYKSHVNCPGIEPGFHGQKQPNFPTLL